VQARQKLSDALNLAPGDVVQFPFSFQLPEGAMAVPLKIMSMAVAFEDVILRGGN